MTLGIVIITGASEGIGLATTQLLSDQGYHVYATCRDPKKAIKLQKLASKISNVSVFELDVTLQKSVDKAVEVIYAKEGKIDIVINNAGFGIYGPAEMHTIDEMRQIFETNVLGVMRMHHAVVPLMRKQCSGKIINIGSIAGAIPSKNMPVYSASKAALEILTAVEAFHHAPHINITLIQPGPVLTSFESRTLYAQRKIKGKNPYDSLAYDREQWKKMMDKGQFPEEVAQVILSVIKATSPNHWNQTSSSVTEAIEKQFKDVTGNSRLPQSYLFKGKLVNITPVKAKL